MLRMKQINSSRRHLGDTVKRRIIFLFKKWYPSPVVIHNYFASSYYRGSFVIVKFSTSLKLSRNIIRGVRSLFHRILENVCVRTCVCVWVWVCVCVCVGLYLRIYAVDFNQIVLIFFCFFFFFLLRIREENNFV